MPESGTLIQQTTFEGASAKYFHLIRFPIVSGKFLTKMHHDLAVNDIDNFLSPRTFTGASKSFQFKQHVDQLEKHSELRTSKEKEFFKTFLDPDSIDIIGSNNKRLHIRLLDDQIPLALIIKQPGPSRIQNINKR